MNSKGLDATASVSTLSDRKFGASTSGSAFLFDVFLSFYGRDTRKGFADFLYTYLVAASIQTFKDNDELRVGEEFGPELRKAIKESKICIPILSKNYADSKWCLRELEQMVECHKRWGIKIFPIFYDVDPSDVRNQRGSYELAFRLHEKKFDKSTVQRWRDALIVVGACKGLELRNETDGIKTKTAEKYWNQNHQAALGEKKEKQLIGTSSTKRKREILHIPLEDIEEHIDKKRVEAANKLGISDTKLAVVLKDYGLTWTKFKNNIRRKQNSGKATQLALTPRGNDVSDTSWHPISESYFQCIETVVTKVVTVVRQYTARSNSAAACAINVSTPSLQNRGTNKQFPFQSQNITSPPETDLSDHHNLAMSIQPGNAYHMSLATIPRGGDVSNTSGLPVLNSSDQCENSTKTAIYQSTNCNNSSSAYSLDNTMSLIQNGGTNCLFPFQPQNITSSPEENVDLSLVDYGFSQELELDLFEDFLPVEINQCSPSTNLHGLASNSVGFVDDMSDHHNSPMPIHPGDANHLSLTTSPHGGDVNNTFGNSASTYSLDNTKSLLQHGETNCQFPFQPQNITSHPEENGGLLYPDNPGHFEYLNNSFRFSVSTQVYDGTNCQLGYQNQDQNQLLVATPTPETGTPDKRQTVTVLAKYRSKTLKFSLSSESTKDDLEKEVTKRVNLQVGSFYLDYKDEAGRWICIGCDEDLKDCMAYVRLLDKTVVEMHVKLND